MSENKIKAKVGGNFVLCPPGNKLANCFAMVMVGTVMESFKGATPVPTEKLFIGFEMTNDRHVFDEEKGPEPFIIWVEYLLSLHKKANLRKMVESWAGQSYSDKEMEEFELNELIGSPCMANVIADTNQKGEERRKIANITAIPAGVTPPAMYYPPLLFTYSNPFNHEAFNRIPEWIQNKMKTSKEYQAAVGSGIAPAPVEQRTTEQATAETQAKGKFPFPPKKPL